VNKIVKGIFLLVTIAGIVAIFAVLLNGHDMPILNPHGTIADQQRNLIVFTVLLGLVVIVPVFIMLFSIAWKYRESNTKAKYSPDWDHSRLYETIWWGVPCVIILILSVVAWKSSHDLDPYRPLTSNVKPIKIQVVSLQWKWLFIYPEQHTASVNLVQFPEDTPVNFEITSDAPMNSFWIPSLGGQVYAMSGMSTKLHLMAGTIGEYKGSSANISGEGFAGMNFVAKSTSKNDFDTWVKTNKDSAPNLDMTEYNKLATPSKNEKAKNYTLEEPNLYDKIIMKYMAPEKQMDHEHMEMH
jgi:cytochrome o ubiquinol oxidase subunit II